MTYLRDVVYDMGPSLFWKALDSNEDYFQRSFGVLVVFPWVLFLIFSSTPPLPLFVLLMLNIYLRQNSMLHILTFDKTLFHKAFYLKNYKERNSNAILKRIRVQAKSETRAVWGVWLMNHSRAKYRIQQWSRNEGIHLITYCPSLTEYVIANYHETLKENWDDISTYKEETSVATATEYSGQQQWPAGVEGCQMIKTRRSVAKLGPGARPKPLRKQEEQRTESASWPTAVTKIYRLAGNNDASFSGQVHTHILKYTCIALPLLSKD